MLIPIIDDRNGAYCELFDMRARVYQYHLSTAITEVLKLSMFKHIKRQELDFLVKEKFSYSNSRSWGPPLVKDDWTGKFVQPVYRRFVSLQDVICRVGGKLGFYCRCCDRVLFIKEEYFSRSGVLSLGSWNHGVCQKCTEESNISYYCKDFDRLIEGYVLAVRSGGSLDKMIEFITKLSVYGPNRIAEEYNISVIQIRCFLSELRRLKINLDHVPAVKRAHKKWKVAYDAMRELGIQL